MVQGWCASEGLEAEPEFAEAASRYVADHRRGICLFGASGTGKTTLASLLSRRCGGWPVLRARELQRRVSQLSREMGDERGFLAAVNAARIDFAGRYDYDLCVDDLGKEARTALSYGNATDIVAEAMEERYDMWREGRGCTLLTTELTYAQLREIYPAHVCNRIEEMCVPVVLREVRRRGWQA